MTKDILEHFNACPSCEPIMCCMGRIQDMCGCRGMPIDFKPTEKCGDDCELNNHNSRQNPTQSAGEG